MADYFAGFAPNGGLLVPAPYVREEPPLADGGLYSTVDDLYRWDRALASGVLPGFVSVFDRYPEDDATVIVLGNTDISVGRISEELAAILFGESYAIPEAHRLTTITEEQFRPCVGTYRSDEGRVFEVSWDEIAVVEEADRFGAGMFAKSPTEFYVPMFRGTAVFRADDSGRVRGLVANIRGRSLSFERVEE